MPTYMINPQWRLQILPSATSSSSRTGTSTGGPEKAKLIVAARTERDVPLNVVVVWGQGERVFECVPSVSAHVHVLCD